MGAGESKPGDQGIVTVATRGGSGSGGAAAAAQAADAGAQLLQHLLSLRALVPDVESRVARSDPSSVWGDIESAKQLGADTRELAAAVGELLGAYRAWHSERARAVSTNQDYINHCIDQAEAKAARALQHLRQQLQRLKALNAALKDAAALPALLTEATGQAAALRARIDAIAAGLPSAGGGGKS